MASKYDLKENLHIPKMSSDSPKEDLTRKEVESTTLDAKSNGKYDTPQPSHIMEGEYAVLQEFNDKESECWLYFLRREGNDKALRHLQKQLESFDQVTMEDMSTFTIELEPWVSAKTAKEMSKIDMNSYSFHRKFDGKLQTIDFAFRKKDSDETKMCKVFDQLSYGQIEDFIDDEDLDPEDLTDCESEEDESEEDESEEDESEEETQSKCDSKKEKIPSLLKKIDIPRWAARKRGKGKKTK